MKPATTEPTPISLTAADLAPGERFGARLPWGALAALFGLTLRQFGHGRRLLVLGLLSLLPAGLAILVRATDNPPPADNEFVVVFTLIPYTIMPLTALLYASGMVQDELEDQTLTYLLVRPLPKWALYLIKLLATMVVAVLLAVFYVCLAYAAVYLGTTSGASFFRVLRAVPLTALSLVAYCSLFGLLGLVTRRSFLVGMVYVVVFEVLLGNFGFALRRLTVTYYGRVLGDRWLDLSDGPGRIKATEAWSLNAATDPSSAACVLTLLAMTGIAAALGVMIFSRREFRMKTPEGS